MKKYIKINPEVISAKIFKRGDHNGMYCSKDGRFHSYTHKKDEDAHKGLRPIIDTGRKPKNFTSLMDFQIGEFDKFYLVVNSDGTKDLIKKDIFEKIYKEFKIKECQ